MISTGRYLAIAAATTAAVALLFTLFPGIDLFVSGLFYDPARGFFLERTRLLMFLDDVMRPILNLGGIGAAIFFLLKALSERPARWSSSRRIYFVLTSVLLGPGLLVSVILKPHWGRARPIQTEPFGGDKLFTPPLQIADQCVGNCSFVSGDVAFFATLLAIALLARPTRRTFWVSVVAVLTALVILKRLAAGAHFFSDTLFATLFPVLVVLVAYRWMLEGKGSADWAMLHGPVAPLADLAPVRALRWRLWRILVRARRVWRRIVRWADAPVQRRRQTVEAAATTPRPTARRARKPRAQSAIGPGAPSGNA